MFKKNSKFCKYLFVYGTLTSKRISDTDVGIDKRLQYFTNGKIKGKLFDLGDYPAAIEDKKSYIYGEIYQIINPKVLEAIDEYEEYYPNRHRDSLYIRKITTAFLNDGKQIPVFAYFFNKNIQNANEIPSGKWLSGKKNLNFDSFWKIITKETVPKNQYYTLSRKIPFTASFAHKKTIIVKPNGKQERPVGFSQFLQVWSKASKISKQERFRPKNYQDMTYNASYILAMIKSILKDQEMS